MKVKVKLFANLKDLAGVSEFEQDLEEGAKVCAFTEIICERYPTLKDMVESRKVFISVNQEMVGKKDTLTEGDEIGLLPPFSGG